MSGLVDFMKHLPSGTIFFVLMPASVVIAALVITRLADLYGEDVITLGELAIWVTLLLTVLLYVVSQWRGVTPYLVAAGYLTAFLIFVRLREAGHKEFAKIDFKQIQGSLKELREGLPKTPRKRAASKAEEAVAAAFEEEETPEQIAVCPFCQRESLIVRGKCMGCGQLVSKARELLD